MSAITTTHNSQENPAVAANRVVYWLSQHWLLLFSVLWGVYVGLPWLAPVFMKIGWTSAGDAIYLVYSTQCHQMPQRSFFLFGSKPMYSLAEIQAAWRVTDNPAILRMYMGDPVMGWKVAWSDRMVSMYTSIFFGGLLYGLLRRRLKALSIWGLGLLVSPLVLDGLTHAISDFAGIGNGFRDNNAWLATLTNHAFSAAFYSGDVLGSFNSDMRLITGVLFGVGIVWFAYPYVQDAFTDAGLRIHDKFERASRAL